MVESFRSTDLFQFLTLLQDYWRLLDGDDLNLSPVDCDILKGEVADLYDIVLF